MLKYTGALEFYSHRILPVCWDPVSRRVICAALHYGQGRAFAVASQQWSSRFLEVPDERPDIHEAIMAWLTRVRARPRLSLPDDNRHIVSCRRGANLDQLLTEARRIVVIFYPDCTVSRLDEFVHRFRWGQFGLILAGAGWSMRTRRNLAFTQLADRLELTFPPVVVVPQDTAYPASLFTRHQHGLGPVSLDLALMRATRSLALFDTAQPDLPDTGQLSAPQRRLIQSESTSSLIANLLTRYSSLMDYVAPCPSRPFRGLTRGQPSLPLPHRHAILNFNRLVFAPSLRYTGLKLPGVSQFPGDFPTRPAHGLRTSQLFLEVNHTVSGEKHTTGFYAPAGATFEYEVAFVEPPGGSEDEPIGWSLEIGCHTDRLEPLARWDRFPVITHRVPLELHGVVFTPVGGVVFLSSSLSSSHLIIHFYGLQEHALMHLRDNLSLSDWAAGRWRYNLAPWSEILGDAVAFCLPTSLVRSASLDYLIRLTRDTWDRVVKADYNFRGDSWRSERRQRVTLDVQLMVGSGHNGYPIVGSLNWFDSIWNLTRIRAIGSWGLCHEIGHNLQRSWWTMPGFTEVTNNVMCLMNYELVFGFASLQPSLKSLTSVKSAAGSGTSASSDGANGELDTEVAEALSYLKRGDAYTNWSPNIGLQYFIHLISHFGLGLISNAWVNYNQFPVKPRGLDNWTLILSKEAGHSLVGLHEFWGLPTGQTTAAQLSKLPCFLPDDWITQQVTDRLAKIRRHQNQTCVTRVSKIEPVNKLTNGFYELLPKDFWRLDPAPSENWPTPRRLND
ncbi:unnamed protein product [Protopolystoma xenopodis]|uniref:Peptidase M60 domain-containing protein n=1 Tax=Protopolystoma xenopodis TaxID=117903 RepID=A0A448WAZ0_9PLAT|nr:unnamed protein product [Protopolystoma xenopodis]